MPSPARLAMSPSLRERGLGRQNLFDMVIRAVAFDFRSYPDRRAEGRIGPLESRPIHRMPDVAEIKSGFACVQNVIARVSPLAILRTEPR